MALRLPRLQSAQDIVAGSKPSNVFQLWWQRVAEAVEGAINNIADVLVRLGLVEVTADGALELAESAIDAGGTIKDDKVLTASIIENGVTDRYLSQTLVDILLPNLVETEITSVSVTKEADDSDIDLDPSIRLKSSDDIRGTMYLYRDALLIDSFDPYMNGAGGTFRISQTLPFSDLDAVAGTYVYKLAFMRNGGASTLYAAAGSLIRAKEFKR